MDEAVGRGPLTGLVVLELGRFVAAPLAGRLLGDWGADVIKVEAPGGDPMRWGPVGERPGLSPQFSSFNRSKRSVTLDLKSDAGRNALLALLADADVLIHNMRSAALLRLGIDTAHLTDQFPKLILCSVSGFGDTGPSATAQAFDSIISGVSGLYAQLGSPNDLTPVGPSFSDILTGMYAAQSVLAALHARSTTGVGQIVDVSMLESAVNAIDDAFTTYFETGVELGPRARQSRQHVFACQSSDGLPFVVQVSSSPVQWKKFVHLLGGSTDADVLHSDARFLDHSARTDHFSELTEIVATATRTRPRAAWLADLQHCDIAAAPVNSIAEAVDDPQIVASQLFTDVSMPYGPPLRMSRTVGRFSETPVAAARRPPEAGEDTPAVLDTLHLSSADRHSLDRAWETRRTRR